MNMLCLHAAQDGTANSWRPKTQTRAPRNPFLTQLFHEAPSAFLPIHVLCAAFHTTRPSLKPREEPDSLLAGGPSDC